MSVRAVLLLAALALACRPAGQATAPDVAARAADEPQRLALRVGESATIGARDPLTVTFQRVLEDSRCPRDVRCAWAGDAAVHLRLARGAERAGATLHTTLEPKQVEYAAGYVVRLVSVRPEPHGGSAVPAEAYEVVLEVLAR